MEVSSSYVLVIARPTDELPILESLRCHGNYSVIVAHSPEEAMMYLQDQLPYLVILIEHRADYAEPLVQRLRCLADEHHRSHLMIIALTDVNDPSWLPQDENPGFDGFLVKPISSDILTSLVQSAWIRQVCCAAS